MEYIFEYFIRKDSFQIKEVKSQFIYWWSAQSLHSVSTYADEI